MRKHVLLVMLQLLFCSIVFAQTDDPGCNLQVTLSDATCNVDQTNCGTTTGCATTTFTVVCTGLYYLKGWTSCTGTNCAHCAVCVSVIKSTGGTLNSCSTINQCDQGTCCNVCTYTLTPGSYTMYVCKFPCNEVDEEPCCDEQYGCTAWGTVSSNSLSCP